MGRARSAAQVELNDGTTVVADEAYLTRAITDPAAQIVAGLRRRRCRATSLTDEEIADVVAYIVDARQRRSDVRM